MEMRRSRIRKIYTKRAKKITKMRFNELFNKFDRKVLVSDIFNTR